MNPVRFGNANTVMTAPPGMPDCVDVHAYRDNEQVITAWCPTPEEMVKLNLGEPVFLCVCGRTMPPVWLSVDNPFV